MDIKYWAHRIMLQEQELEESFKQLELDFISIDELDMEEEEDMPFSDRYTPIDKLMERWPDYDDQQ